LAWVAESEGERDWSKRFLDEVRKRWEGGKLVELESWYWHWGIDWVSVQPDWRGDMAAFLLGELLRQVEGSVEVAGLVLDDEFKRELATSWASKGLFDQALKVTEGIKQVEERARSLAEIAGEMAKARKMERAKEVFEQALKVVEGIENASEQSEALKEIAKEMANVGMVEWAKEVFNQALKATEGIEDAWRRAWALREIAVEMAKAGMFEQALKVAEGIEDADERAGALREIAEEMAKAGMFEQALKVAEGIEDADERAGALREIAEEMAKAGEVEGVVSIVEREMAVRTEGLPSVLEVLAGQASEGDGKSKEGFLKLLPWCGWSLEFAYKACGLLAWLYPERGEEIAGVIAATGD
jgi:tetratricopeptide (TPR) repeat protein